jgi:hypothetical protein
MRPLHLKFALLSRSDVLQRTPQIGDVAVTTESGGIACANGGYNYVA